jgi:hypothetical protein
MTAPKSDRPQRIMGRDAKFHRLTRPGVANLERATASRQRLIEPVGLILQTAKREPR